MYQTARVTAVIKFPYVSVWCRRTDELVDGPNAAHITPKALDRWEERLTDLFNRCPYDMYDAALAHTVMKYPVDIQVWASYQWSTMLCGL